MAYTRIHPIKATVQKSVDYICNPDKTEGELLVSSFSCTPKYAGYEFKAALSETKSTDKNKAYNVIQSFAPGEVTAEEAHKIGMELADRLLKGNYSYVLATHNDRKYPHNHLIFCAADNYEHKKYNDCLKSYYHIREISDRLCFEHNLSITTPGKRRGKSYAEWTGEASDHLGRNIRGKHLNRGYQNGKRIPLEPLKPSDLITRISLKELPRKGHSLIPLTRNLRTVRDLPTGLISRTLRLLRLPMRKPGI